MAVHAEQGAFHQGGEDVDAPDDEHVIGSTADLLHAHEGAAALTFFGVQNGEVAGAIADDRHGLFRQRGENEFAFLAIGE